MNSNGDNENFFAVYSCKMQHSIFFLSFQISLEFYQRKRARWPFPAECIPWEVWTIKLDIISLSNEHRKLLLLILLSVYLGRCGQ